MRFVSLLFLLVLVACTPAVAQMPTPVAMISTAVATDVPLPTNTIQPTETAEPTTIVETTVAVEYAGIATSDANVRDKPTTQGSIILGQVTTGEAVQLRMRNAESTWYGLVTSTGLRGWVSASLLTIDEAVAAQVPVGTTEDFGAVLPADQAVPADSSEPPATAELTIPVDRLTAVTTAMSEAYGSSQVEVDEVEPGVLVVTIPLKVISSKRLMRAGLFLDMTNIANAAYTSSYDLQQLTMIATAELTDQLGNTSTGAVARITLPRETADKINWAQFDRNNLFDVGDNAFLHPILQE